MSGTLLGLRVPMSAVVRRDASRVLLGMCLVTLPTPRAAILFAQTSRVEDAARCTQAATLVRAFDESVVRSGSLANQGTGKLEERGEAVATLLRCGATGGRAAAATIRLTRHMMDREVILTLTSSYRTFRDTAVIAAATEVASDAAASTVARVVALRTMWLVQTGKFWFGIEEMYPPKVGTADEIRMARCGEGVQFAEKRPSWEVGVEPPPGFATTLQAVANRLRDDASQPVEVRVAALCVLVP